MSGSGGSCAEQCATYIPAMQIFLFLFCHSRELSHLQSELVSSLARTRVKARKNRGVKESDVPATQTSAARPHVRTSRAHDPARFYPSALKYFRGWNHCLPDSGQSKPCVGPLRTCLGVVVPLIDALDSGRAWLPSRPQGNARRVHRATA